MTKLARTEADPQYDVSVAIYQEGGTAAGNVYTSFSAAHAALAGLEDGRRLVVDESHGACVTGAGAFDMAGIKLAAAWPTTELTVSDGCTLPNLLYTTDWLTLTCDASAAPVQFTAGLQTFNNGFGCTIQSNTGKAPLIEVSNAATLIHNGNHLAEIADAGAEVIELTDTATLNINTTAGGGVDDNTLISAIGTAIVGRYGAIGGEISTTQASVDGSMDISYSKGAGALAVGVDDSSLPYSANNAQEALEAQAVEYPDMTEVSSVATYSDVSTTDKLITTMTITPGAGTYMVMASGAYSNDTASKDSWVSIYANGAQIPHTERMFVGIAQVCCRTFATQAVVTVAGGQAIELRLRAEAGGSAAEAMKRSMVLWPVQ